MSAQQKDVAVVALEGEIDLSAVPEVERRIEAAEREAPGELVLDLRQVTFMDSSGLRVILAAHHRAEERGGAYSLVKGGEAVSRLLEVTGLTARLRILDEPPASG